MLFWLKFYVSLIFLVLIYYNYSLNNFMSLILFSELLLVLCFHLYVFSAIIFSLNWIFGFSFIIVILGGLEIALSFLLLIL